MIETSFPTTFYGSSDSQTAIRAMCDYARSRGTVIDFREITAENAEATGGIPDSRRGVWLFPGQLQYDLALTKRVVPRQSNPFAAPTGDTSLRECLQTMAVALSEALKKV